MQSNIKNKSKTNIQTRTFTITEENRLLTNGSSILVPFIRLRGLWLKKAGFYIGQKIKVCISENRLIITPKKQNKP